MSGRKGGQCPKLVQDMMGGMFYLMQPTTTLHHRHLICICTNRRDGGQCPQLVQDEGIVSPPPLSTEDNLHSCFQLELTGENVRLEFDELLAQFFRAKPSGQS